ncbi:MAG: hypothetical protein QXZ25_00305 [Candidatus Bathyarchaeia archaeon]
MAQENFDKILLLAVEEGLSSLGDSPKQAILFHLETSFKIKKEHIPTNLTKFAKALEEIFGPGAPYLEKLIMRRLYEKLGLLFENSAVVDFSERVEAAKKHLMSSGECTVK